MWSEFIFSKSSSSWPVYVLTIYLFFFIIYELISVFCWTRESIYYYLYFISLSSNNSNLLIVSLIFYINRLKKLRCYYYWNVRSYIIQLLLLTQKGSAYEIIIFYALNQKFWYICWTKNVVVSIYYNFTLII